MDPSQAVEMIKWLALLSVLLAFISAVVALIKKKS